MVRRVLLHGQQDLGIGRGDQGLPKGIERPTRLDSPLLELFSVVKDDALVGQGLDADPKERLAVLHSSRVSTAQVNPDPIGVGAGVVIARVTEEK